MGLLGSSFGTIPLKCFGCKAEMPAAELLDGTDPPLYRLWMRVPFVFKLLASVILGLAALWVGSLLGEFSLLNPWSIITPWMAIPILMAHWHTSDGSRRMGLCGAGRLRLVSFSASMVLSLFAFGLAQFGRHMLDMYREPFPLLLYVPVVVGIFLIPTVTYRLGTRIVESTYEYRFYQRQALDLTYDYEDENDG